MLVEILATILLVLNSEGVSLQAEAVAATPFGFNNKEPISKRLGAALEAIAKRKGYWHKTAFYDWEVSDWQTDCNLHYVREHYWSVDTLPQMKELDFFPSLDHCNAMYKVGADYYAFLGNLYPVAAPWEQDNINFLREETTKLLSFWQIACAIRQYEKDENPLYCRKSIRELREKLGGLPIESMWSVPNLPWQFFGS